MHPAERITSSDLAYHLCFFITTFSGHFLSAILKVPHYFMN